MTGQAAAGIGPDYTTHARAERLIAGGRFVLASFSLFAIYLEPSTPARFQRVTYAALLIYTLYALVMVLVEWRSPRASRRWQLISHAVELALFTIFVYLTEGPASPFFLYFIFSLFCAMLRFTWRGILATAVASMAVYGAMAVLASIADPDFELSRVLIRESYLAVIAALLVYLGVYQQRLRRELASLAAWPRELASEIDGVLQSTLAHAASVLNARRVVLVWEEREEPWVHAATWADGALHVDRLAPGTIEAAAKPELRNTSFYVRGPGHPTLVYGAERGVVWASGLPSGGGHEGRPEAHTTPAFFGITAAIGVSLESETLSAQLLVPDARGVTGDDLALAHIVGRLVLATLEQFLFVQQVRIAASADERLRISRELHDGIVQSLGGAGLQLQAIRRQLPSDFPAAERLGHVQRVIEQDQRELRAIVRELRPQDAREGREILADGLQRIRERFPLEWGLAVDIDLSGPLDVSQRLANELCRLINESLSNAARHGGASQAKVALTIDDGAVVLRVCDNGRGFPFAGRYDLDDLTRSGSGPRTLKERVTALGGSLTVESSSGGASIDARIPILQESGR